MTRPVPNLRASLVDALGIIKNPWNLWFQQFSQAPPNIQNIVLGASPYLIDVHDFGNIVVTGGTISSIVLTRGNISLNLTGQKLIPIAIGDVVIVTYSVLPTIQFIPGQ